MDGRALVALIAAGIGWYKWGPTQSNNAAPAPNTTSAPSTLVREAKVDLNQPYQNTPTAAWVDGIAGISMPQATQVGSFSAERVASAIEKVKQAITAGRLDPKVLEGHGTSGFLARFSPSEQEYVKPFLDKEPKTDASGYVTLLADGFRLLPAGPGDIVAFHRRELDYRWQSSPPFEKRDAGLSHGDSQGSTSSMACGASKKGYLAPVYSEKAAPDSPEATEDEARQYDVNKPMPTEDTCK